MGGPCVLTLSGPLSGMARIPNVEQTYYLRAGVLARERLGLLLTEAYLFEGGESFDLLFTEVTAFLTNETHAGAALGYCGGSSTH